MKKIKYLDNVIEVPENTTNEQARESLRAIFPEVANATIEEIEGGIEFKVQANTKGSDSVKVIYGDNELTLPAHLTDSEIRDSLKAVFPEIASATAEREGDVVTFRVAANTKGA